MTKDTVIISVEDFLELRGKAHELATIDNGTHIRIVPIFIGTTKSVHSRAYCITHSELEDKLNTEDAASRTAISKLAGVCNERKHEINELICRASAAELSLRDKTGIVHELETTLGKIHSRNYFVNLLLAIVGTK